MLRPRTFLANARDIGGSSKRFLARQVGRYGALAVPTVVIAGDRDTVVPSRQHAVLFAAAVPGAKLKLWPGLGHMVHHAAPDRVAAAIEEIAR